MAWIWNTTHVKHVKMLLCMYACLIHTHTYMYTNICIQIEGFTHEEHHMWKCISGLHQHNMHMSCICEYACVNIHTYYIYKYIIHIMCMSLFAIYVHIRPYKLYIYAQNVWIYLYIFIHIHTFTHIHTNVYSSNHDLLCTQNPAAKKGQNVSIYVCVYLQLRKRRTPESMCTQTQAGRLVPNVCPTNTCACIEMCQKYAYKHVLMYVYICITRWFLFRDPRHVRMNVHDCACICVKVCACMYRTCKLLRMIQSS
jgi:hypothetical protein